MNWKTGLGPLENSRYDESSFDFSLARLDSWGIICVQGQHCQSYLQGKITCDVISLEKNSFTFGAQCNANGKVCSVFRLFHHNGGYALAQPKSLISVGLHELKKYALFSKVEIASSSEPVLALFGSMATQFIDTVTETRGDVRRIDGGTAINTGPHTWMVIAGNEAIVENLVTRCSPRVVPEANWLYREIVSGVPILTRQQQFEYTPQALNLQIIGGISFKKGCYLGQEVVARARYRGTNKRSLYALEGELAKPVEPVEIERSTTGEHWRSAGKLMNLVKVSRDRWMGQLVLPNHLDSDTLFRSGSQHTVWHRLALPYSAEKLETK